MLNIGFGGGGDCHQNVSAILQISYELFNGYKPKADVSKILRSYCSSYPTLYMFL